LLFRKEVTSINEDHCELNNIQIMPVACNKMEEAPRKSRRQAAKKEQKASQSDMPTAKKRKAATPAKSPRNTPKKKNKQKGDATAEKQLKAQKRKKAVTKSTTAREDQQQKNLEIAAEKEAAKKDHELRKRVVADRKEKKRREKAAAAAAAAGNKQQDARKGANGTVAAAGGGDIDKKGPGRPKSSGQKKSRKPTLDEEETKAFLERRQEFEDNYGEPGENPVAYRTEVLQENLGGLPKVLDSNGTQFDVTGTELSINGGDVVRYHVYDPKETNMMLCVSCMNNALTVPMKGFTCQHMYAQHSKPDQCWGEGRELTSRMNTTYETALNRERVKKEKQKEKIGNSIAKKLEELEELKEQKNMLAEDLEGDDSKDGKAGSM